IEIVLEYEPKLGSDTADMVGAEQVVAVNEHATVAVNGTYRGFTEPDKTGLHQDTNRLYGANISAQLNYTNPSGSALLSALPEISTSFNDSILVKKKGTGAKLDLMGSYRRFKVSALMQSFTESYETMGNISSIHGRIHSNAAADLTYEFSPIAPLQTGGSYLDAAFGREFEQHSQLLLSLSNLPSLKLAAMHRQSAVLKHGTTTKKDSVNSRSLLGRIETEWNLPENATRLLHINRLWFNGSYALSHRFDTLFDTTAAQRSNVDSTLTVQNRNHNLFGWLQLSPFKNLSLETKQVLRYLQDNNTQTSSWKVRQRLYRPQTSLFSQDAIPGVTLYGKHTYSSSRTSLLSGFAGSTDSLRDSLITIDEQGLNSTVLLIPGVWWNILNPLQYSMGYTITEATKSLQHGSTSDTMISRTTGSTITINPILTFDYGYSLRIANKTEKTIQKRFDKLLSDDYKIGTDIETVMRQRKTRATVEYDLSHATDYRFATIGTSGDTVVTTVMHGLGLRWNQRWSSLLRSEIPLKLRWKKTDSTKAETVLTQPFASEIAGGFLIDLRGAKGFISDLRLQYYTGLTLYDGTFFTPSSYHKSWDNKIDMGMKLWRNLSLRLLMSGIYVFDDIAKVLKYDLAELKVTALF
ncbi:MAG: hypothetical protein JW795_10805, partial [Chitinivibrionales bacterium]|nr:hypothetical protein [Chitinivibrionales bacterium]